MLLLLACVRHPAPVPAAPLGGDAWGFVEFVSPTTRTVVLRLFPGPEAPEFGHHGEAFPPPVPHVIDTRGADRAVDEIVSFAADGRHLFAIDDGALWLVDTEQASWERIEGADLADDGNACLDPRVAAFDETGARVGWIAGDRFVVRDLASGDEVGITAKARIWRAWPAVGGATLLEAAGEFPRQKTSCACRWCNRFALSYGFYGWHGEFAMIYADAAGNRVEADGATRVGTAVMKEGVLRRLDGSEVAIPAGCSVRTAVAGAASAGLDCGAGPAWWWPDSGRIVEVPAMRPLGEDAVATRAPGGHALVAVQLEDGRVARLDLDTGEVTPGPKAEEIGPTSTAGTVLVRDGSVVTAWSLVTGRATVVPLPEGTTPTRLGAQVIGLGEERRLFIDATGTRRGELASFASQPNADGCVLVASVEGPQGVERGPWRVECAKE